ncbi:MAG: hypothetical protein HOQ17_15735 [Gemmatimonadaceae bacterium]|nr:hypothetical protein [Gemmatimonadaceae bacterium]NUO95297.1 hypothetical protein [Gemmatimonadaceae bacterium]NUP55944.1 hypothetical protein [Gemmatimonadaceae bacterium]NUP70359.1 hypothetical protein [Gemmatimonadaceae bacterium]NUR36162.1 hypothetical protein [Gemmatimonadaceae bacterium]
MSFLVSLLLPVIATVLYLRAYVQRAGIGMAPARISATRALGSGALTGAAALVFLGVLGVIVLAYRGRTLTPPGIDVSAAAFWATQFLVAAAIGAAVGALSAAALLPWVRSRLARLTPATGQ